MPTAAKGTAPGSMEHADAELGDDDDTDEDPDGEYSSSSRVASDDDVENSDDSQDVEMAELQGQAETVPSTKVERPSPDADGSRTSRTTPTKTPKSGSPKITPPEELGRNVNQTSPSTPGSNIKRRKPDVITLSSDDEAGGDDAQLDEGNESVHAAPSDDNMSDEEEPLARKSKRRKQVLQQVPVQQVLVTGPDDAPGQLPLDLEVLCPVESACWSSNLCKTYLWVLPLCTDMWRCYSTGSDHSDQRILTRGWNK